jgi:hypothetical protein
MQLIQARATANRTVNTKFGEKRVIDAVTASGEQITLWRPVEDPASKSITNGSRIQVAIDAKGKPSLIESPADRAEAAPLSLPMEAEMKVRKQMGFVKPEPAPAGRSAEIADYVERLGKLYSHCYTTAFNQLGNTTPLATPEIKDVATTLFIQTVKHFQL